MAASSAEETKISLKVQGIEIEIAISRQGSAGSEAAPEVVVSTSAEPARGEEQSVPETVVSVPPATPWPCLTELREQIALPADEGELNRFLDLLREGRGQTTGPRAGSQAEISMYAVRRHPSPQFEGLWIGRPGTRVWAALLATTRRGSMFGSGMDLKRVQTVEEAWAFWTLRGQSELMPLHLI